MNIWTLITSSLALYGLVTVALIGAADILLTNKIQGTVVSKKYPATLLTCVAAALLLKVLLDHRAYLQALPDFVVIAGYRFFARGAKPRRSPEGEAA